MIAGATPSDDPALAQGWKRVATAAGAMVATSHPAVTATAVDVLRAGGNAVDAMLTAIPLQQVLEPQLSTIAGGFGMLCWDAASRSGTYLKRNADHPAEGTSPASGTPDTSGERVAVPGTVIGMRAAADRFGTRAWETYFAPAISAAEDGFAMYAHVYSAMGAPPMPASRTTTRAGSGTCRMGYIPPRGRALSPTETGRPPGVDDHLDLLPPIEQLPCMGSASAGG